MQRLPACQHRRGTDRHGMRLCRGHAVWRRAHLAIVGLVSEKLLEFIYDYCHNNSPLTGLATTIIGTRFLRGDCGDLIPRHSIRCSSSLPSLTERNMS